jgi:hypothetical protein
MHFKHTIRPIPSVIIIVMDEVSLWIGDTKGEWGHTRAINTTLLNTCELSKEGMTVEGRLSDLSSEDNSI